MHGSHLFGARRLVQQSADTAAADAGNELGDPDAQNETSVIAVSPSNRVEILRERIVDVLRRCKAQCGQLARCIKAEDCGGNQSCKVDTTKAARAAQSSHTGMHVVRTNS